MSALTAEEFMKITKENTEALLRQREVNFKLRADERAEQLEAISSLIKSGVKEEVAAVVKPLQEENEKRFGSLESDIKQIMNIIKTKTPNSAPPPTVPPPQALNSEQLPAQPSTSQNQDSIFTVSLLMVAVSLPQLTCTQGPGHQPIRRSSGKDLKLVDLLLGLSPLTTATCRGSAGCTT